MSCSVHRATIVALVLAGVALACSSPDTDARIDPIGPDKAEFRAVAPVLARRCGSVDCHGTRLRNLRVFGYGGLRLLDGHRLDDPPIVTDDEANATYDSVIGLEPELMRAVVLAGGADPERLSFVRKGRGDEDHKGDRRVIPGDDADTCILTWLSRTTKIDACKRAGCVGDGGDIQTCGPGQR